MDKIEKIGELKVIPGEPLEVPYWFQVYLGELWDWQRRSARSDYLFGPGPGCDRIPHIRLEHTSETE